ncbi:uncharacterized protein [Nicotiana sylvestris]|uniref:uncharacterized protein n=1 Tax=Nicotiana sylvestris TaxID=4096 RepID=UPI00388C9BD8
MVAIEKLEKQVIDLKFEIDLHIAADDGEKRKLAQENEVLKAQIQEMKIATINPKRSRADERLINGLKKKALEYQEDLEKSEAGFEEINRELSQFEEKSKPNLNDTKADNLGDAVDIRENKISIHIAPNIREELIKALIEFKDVFAWSYDDMPGLNTDLVVHKLPIKLACPPVKHKLRKFKTDMSVNIKEEVTKQLQAKILLTEFDIVYVTRTTMKDQALADHLAENPVDKESEPLRTYFPDEEVMQVDELELSEEPAFVQKDFFFFYLCKSSLLGLNTLSPQQFVFEKEFQSLLPIAKSIDSVSELIRAQAVLNPIAAVLSVAYLLLTSPSSCPVFQSSPWREYEDEALGPDMNKKRKGRVATACPDETAALTSGLNPDVEKEDKDRSSLRRRMRADLDVSGVTKEAKKSLQQCKKMYDHAILRLHGELSFHEKERNNIALKREDSEARDSRGDKELRELRASLKVEQSSSRISQLEANISGLKEQSEIVTGELATSRGLLSDTRREIATLAAAKSEADLDATDYKEDAATTHAMVRDISLAAGQKLARAIEHAKAKREVLEELEARGVELSADLEEACVMEGILAPMIVPDGGEDDSGEE